MVTNYRIAEFKFSRWQEGKSANGARRRQIFKDLVSLYLNKTNKKKELYTYDKEHVEKILSSKKAEWRTVLSKSEMCIRDRPDIGPESLFFQAVTSGHIAMVASADIEMMNGVVHSLSYTYEFTKL